jgi:hypothetical protein
VSKNALYHTARDAVHAPSAAVAGATVACFLQGEHKHAGFIHHKLAGSLKAHLQECGKLVNREVLFDCRRGVLR